MSPQLQNITASATHELRALLDAAVDAIIVIDGSGSIETFNRSAERLFGYPAAEVLGRNVNMLMPEPDHGLHDAYLHRYRTTGVAHIIGIGREVRARRKDGSLFPAALSVGQVEGDPPRFVGFVRDLSARVAAEREITQARERLTHVARLSTMGEMAAGLSHELNQPLAAIATYAKACQYLMDKGDAADAAEIREALTQISQQALRAGEVIRRLRTFVTNREVSHERVSCRRLLEDLQALARPDARANDVRLVFEVGPDVPDVMADAVQLQQVLINLIRNGIDAMHQAGSPRREIVVSARTVPDGVEFAVRDFGPGLEPIAIANLFNPFFTTKANGTGLGLPISRTIVNAHGGKLTLGPADQSGACFRFTLPAAESSA